MPPVTAVPSPEQVAAVAAQIEQQPPADSAKLRRRAALRSWPGVPVTDITVVVGFKDPNGERREVIHQVDGADYRITKCIHETSEKVAAVREEGAIIGFEPTGEFRLKLDATFVKE
jgi:hypothetical protein